jgi:IS30 family transposase
VNGVRLSPDIRGAFRKLAKTDLSVTGIAKAFNTTRQTVYRWLTRGKHRGLETFKDKPRQPKQGKVTSDFELSILKLRTTLKWGTARIQQGIYCLPSFMLESLNCIQGVTLSRETINRALAKNNQNDYGHEFKRWKFFRANAPDELWQIDFRGPFSVQENNSGF